MTRPRLYLVQPHRYCKVCRLLLPTRTNPDHFLRRQCWRWERGHDSRVLPGYIHCRVVEARLSPSASDFETTLIVTKALKAAWHLPVSKNNYGIAPLDSYMVEHPPKPAPIAITATGTVLANKMLRLIPDLLAGDVPATIGRRLGAAADKVERQQRRLAALLSAVDALDPDGNLSVWHVSERLAGAMERFQGAGYRRVRAGNTVDAQLKADPRF